jgi:hypothetical protein
MAHGSRGRWLRAAATGLGVVVCTTLIGCQNTDKWKDNKTAPRQQTGLPGTPTLQPGTGATTRTNTQPNQWVGPGSNLQPGSNVMPAGGGAPGTGNQFIRNTGGVNNLTSQPQQLPNLPAQPGVGSQIGSPTQPGMGYAPPGGLGMSPPTPGGASAFTTEPRPVALPLDGGPVPPPPPGGASAPPPSSYLRPSTSGLDYGSGVVPPIAPISPPAAQSGIPPTFK